MTNILTQEESDAFETWPEKIYLQHGNDWIAPYSEHAISEISWCEDEVFENDIEYVRADLHAALLARVAELEKERKEWLACHEFDDGTQIGLKLYDDEIRIESSHFLSYTRQEDDSIRLIINKEF